LAVMQPPNLPNHRHGDHFLILCSKMQQSRLNTRVSFKSASPR
jgi:hypothetical protein